MKSLTVTEKDIEEYTPHLKDMLARLYKFILKHRETNKDYNFTLLGLNYAQQRLYGSASEFVSNKFIQNLDMMKRIAEEQPKYEVIHQFNKEIYDSNSVIRETYIEEVKEIVFGYDEELVKYNASLKHRNSPKDYYSLIINKIN